MIKKIFIKSFSSILLIFSFTAIVSGNTLNDSEEFLNNFVDDALKIMNKTETSDVSRSSELIEFITPMVDGNLVAKSTLGKKYWETMNTMEREEFLIALRDYLSRRVSVYVKNYVATDINFKILKSEYVGKNDKYIKIFSNISEKGTETLAFKINWFLSQENQDLKIFNIEVDDGVHLLKILKDQIQSVLKKHDGNINLLIEELSELE